MEGRKAEAAELTLEPRMGTGLGSREELALPPVARVGALLEKGLPCVPATIPPADLSECVLSAAEKPTVAGCREITCLRFLLFSSCFLSLGWGLTSHLFKVSSSACAT
jgi:hypothetical protein|mmetsp:Transcript_110066/g.173469  ORF Transcript_110066/g.173469 Transcript_110066/m.173469 type:complete len:108 (-) Transcript_110066:494-817(-)